MKIKVCAKLNTNERVMFEYESDFVPDVGEELFWESDIGECKSLEYATVIKRQVIEHFFNGERETIVRLYVAEEFC